MSQLRIFAKELKISNEMVKKCNAGAHNLKDRELNIENNEESSLRS